MTWRIEVSAAAGKDLAALDRFIAGRILNFLADRVVPLDDPRGIGEALRGPVLGRFWEYRVGDPRIIVGIQDTALLIPVVRIGNGKDVCRR